MTEEIRYIVSFEVIVRAKKNMRTEDITQFFSRGLRDYAKDSNITELDFLKLYAKKLEGES